MELHLKIIGTALILLSLVHTVFPRYLQWDKELAQLSLINRQIMKVHTFFIALGVLLMGVLCVTSASELIETNLGRNISLGLGFFWSCRLAIQLFGYSSKLWRGKTFETVVHIFFTGFWIYLSVVFWMIGTD